jgi:predicted RNA-binding Zn ribbon-like protein
MKRLPGHSKSAVQAAVEVVNLRNSGSLVTVEQILAVVKRAGYSPESTVTINFSTETDEALKALEDVLRSELPGAAEAVNRVLRNVAARLELRRDNKGGWHLRAISKPPEFMAQLVLDAVMGVAALVEIDDLTRLSTCADPECTNVTFDVSKNRSRRYCSVAHGNKAAVAAYRARRAAE